MSKEVGCRHVWDPYASISIPLCNTTEQIQNFSKLYQDKYMYMNANELYDLTGCPKNCKYYTYTMLKEYALSDKEMSEKKEIWLELILAGQNINVKKEILIFPLRSFISEFGGALGLFLGFSFIMIWDAIETLLMFLKQYFMKKEWIVLNINDKSINWVYVFKLWNKR